MHGHTTTRSDPGWASRAPPARSAGAQRTAPPPRWREPWEFRGGRCRLSRQRRSRGSGGSVPLVRNCPWPLLPLVSGSEKGVLALTPPDDRGAMRVEGSGERVLAFAVREEEKIVGFVGLQHREQGSFP